MPLDRGTDEPPSTGIRPASINASTEDRTARWFPANGTARCVVVVVDDRASRFYPFPQSSRCVSAAATIRELSISQTAPRRRRAWRHFAKHGERLRKGDEIIELRIDAGPEVAGGVLRRERARRRQVAFAQLLET